MNDRLKILQLSTLDIGGGAEQVALNLHHGYRALGHDAWLAVGARRSQEPGVVTIDNDAERSHFAQMARSVARRLSAQLPAAAASVLRRAAVAVGEPMRALDVLRGREDFAMPASAGLLTKLPSIPDVVHGHNLHGGYFDLRQLPSISARVPVVITLHDMWLFTGHCAYSLGCDRWSTGCGRCPDLDIYAPIRRDATAFNLKRKREICSSSRICIATPSRWLMEKVERSMIATGLVERRVIPNGVDLESFFPGSRADARRRLGIEGPSRVLLYVAKSVVAGDKFKDYATIEGAVAHITHGHAHSDVQLLVVGSHRAGREGRTVFVPFTRDRRELGDYYRAADVFLHAAREDNFPNTVLESLACGTPVVATRVGGVAEQIDEGLTGITVSAGDSAAMAAEVSKLLDDPRRLSEMSRNAAAVARERYGLAQQVREYTSWFEELASEWARRKKVTAT
jgi:glycosyltransferase involved in cell wall biosynthesis